MVDNVKGAGYTYTPAAVQSSAKPTERTEANKPDAAKEPKKDKFEQSTAGYTPAYTKSTADSKKTDGAEKTSGAFVNKSALQTKNEAMKDMVMSTISGQANGAKNADSALDAIYKKYGISKIESDGSDDFWGAEKTAQRILDFAKALGGNDLAAVKKLRKAVDTAFGQCGRIWGGKLPGVCYETYDIIQKGFDDWEKQLSAEE